MKELVLNVKGMMCNGCEKRIKNALSEIEGVMEVIADHVEGKVIITANENVTEDSIKEIILDLGFEI